MAGWCATARLSWDSLIPPTAASANASRDAAAHGIGGGIGRTNEPERCRYPPVDIPPPNPHPGYDGGLIHTESVTHVLGPKCHPCPHLFRPRGTTALWRITHDAASRGLGLRQGEEFPPGRGVSTRERSFHQGEGSPPGRGVSTTESGFHQREWFPPERVVST